MGKLNKLLDRHQPGKCAKGGRSSGFLSYNNENIKHVSWCLSNNIAISVVPNWETDKLWMLQIKIKGTINTDPVDYTDEAALIKMYEYYKYYHDKYNKDKIQNSVKSV